jgi:hypothetical protein
MITTKFFQEQIFLSLILVKALIIRECQRKKQHLMNMTVLWEDQQIKTIKQSGIGRYQGRVMIS